MGAAVVSKGQRGLADNDMPSNCPAANLSTPTYAIIAALSVQSTKGGATNAISSSAQSAVSRARISVFAATPPATAKVGLLGFSAIYCVSAQRDFLFNNVSHGGLKTSTQVRLILYR